MAFIHHLSSGAMKSELDLFTVPPTQIAIENGSFSEYNPISSISDNVPIEFYVSGSGSQYLDLSNTQLYVRAQIVRGNNTPIDNTSEVGPINLLMQSLWSDLEIKLNDKIVTSSNNTYGYRAYIETLLSYGESAKKSHLTSALFQKDVGGHFDEANPLNAQGHNTGLKNVTLYSTMEM